MPLKLINPTPGRSPYYRVRGTYLGQHVNRSTKTGERKIAVKLLALWKEEIERGSYSRPDDPTFASAALAYMQGGGEKRFLTPLIKHFGTTFLARIDQAAVDAAAAALYPAAPSSTRNRQVYTPVCAVLRHVGAPVKITRPKGWAGKARPHWLRPEEAIRLIDGATSVLPRFGALCAFLFYTGVRLGEARGLLVKDLDLPRAFALIGKTKNGEPQAVYLPPAIVAILAECNLKRERVFYGFTGGGRLYAMLAEAEKRSGAILPEGVSFHIFRHTYGAMMKRLGVDLIDLGRWKSINSTKIYDHADASEAARKADFLPVRRAK